ncbi:hypothetical protein SK128_016323 [Halocaridina rubra]|uniref:Uncharacterized protein n=1 Tax=Halocaridina rubra TaxID=373956 RepID=A0AAN8WDH2_HALRR
MTQAILIHLILDLAKLRGDRHHCYPFPILDMIMENISPLNKFSIFLTCGYICVRERKKYT